MGFVKIDQLAQLYRAAGIKNVDILPGAHDRAARMYAHTGYPDGVQLLDQHHTAQGISMPEINSIQYMTFWAKYPVMCNTYPWKNGRLTICAAGPTYTAGSGGPLGPVTSGNRAGWSREIGNNGIGEPYPPAQQDTILKATAVEVEYFGNEYDWPAEWEWWRVPAHFEWAPGRKIDPAGPSQWTNNRHEMWNMKAFRADVRALQKSLYGAEDMLNFLSAPKRIYDSREHEPLKMGETRVISHGKYASVCAANVTVLSSGEEGYLSVAGIANATDTSITNFDKDHEANGTYVGATPDGKLYLYVNGPNKYARVHVIVDLSMYGVGNVVTE